MVTTAEARSESVVGIGQDDSWPRAEQVALFLDFENLVLGAASSLPGCAEPVPAEALTWLCRAYGNASIRRAYADWADARFGRYQEALERNGVDQLQIGRGPSRKNAADIRMAAVGRHPDQFVPCRRATLATPE